MHAAYQFWAIHVDERMKQWFRYIFSRSFLRTVFRLGMVWILLLGGLWFYLKVYTQPGSTRLMPDLKTVRLQEASDELTSLGLVPVHLDSIYSRKGRPFEVIDQVPPAASKIKAGRKVYLTTYRSTPPFERLGIEEGQDPGIARIILENKGFEVEETFEPNLALVGRVIRMEDERGNSLAPDVRRPKGTRVVLVSGTTTREFVGVPNVKGLTLAEARTTVLKAKMSIGLVEFAESVEDASDSARAKVLEQHLLPTRDKAVPAGTELDLYLGLRWDRGRIEQN